VELGLNTLDKGYNTNYYATKKAWLSVGATIKDDETKNGVQVFYWGQVGKKVKDENNEDKLKTYRFLKVSWVYNSQQVDLSNSSWKVPTPKKVVNQVNENDKIENFVKNQIGLNLQYSNNDRCYYSPKLDFIHMSNKFNFEPTKNGTDATLEYYSTLLHELTHWTGSEKRLNRFEKNKKYFDNNAN
jgi:antirestriction protein ArdC